jgi:hypothetical protein
MASQVRIAPTQTGKIVPIRITDADRLTVLQGMGVPEGWIELFKMRENGEPWEKIERKARCSPEQLKHGLSTLYAAMESALHDLARRRARLLP